MCQLCVVPYTRSGAGYAASQGWYSPPHVMARGKFRIGALITVGAGPVTYRNNDGPVRSIVQPWVLPADRLRMRRSDSAERARPIRRARHPWCSRGPAGRAGRPDGRVGVRDRQRWRRYSARWAAHRKATGRHLLPGTIVVVRAVRIGERTRADTVPGRACWSAGEAEPCGPGHSQGGGLDSVGYSRNRRFGEVGIAFSKVDQGLVIHFASARDVLRWQAHPAHAGLVVHAEATAQRERRVELRVGRVGLDQAELQGSGQELRRADRHRRGALRFELAFQPVEVGGARQRRRSSGQVGLHEPERPEDRADVIGDRDVSGSRGALGGDE